MSLYPVHQPAPVSIRLLGQFRLSVGDEPQSGEAQAPQAKLSRRVAELLQLLSLQPARSLMHDQVIEALWQRLSNVRCFVEARASSLGGANAFPKCDC